MDIWIINKQFSQAASPVVVWSYKDKKQNSPNLGHKIFEG